MVDNNKNNEHQAYLDERNILIDSEREQSKSFDKYILTLSSGALALSLTFIKFKKDINSETFYLIIISWILFSASLLFTLSSFLTSQWACKKQREILDNLYENKDSSNTNCYSKITNVFNILSIISFIVAVSFFLIFVSININYKPEEETMTRKKQAGYVPPKEPKILKENRGYTPPDPPKKPIKQEDTNKPIKKP